jgi:hypothetical protein
MKTLFESIQSGEILPSSRKSKFKAYNPTAAQLLEAQREVEEADIFAPAKILFGSARSSQGS